jgi:hypothetical protein
MKFVFDVIDGLYCLLFHNRQHYLRACTYRAYGGRFRVYECFKCGRQWEE